MTRTSRALAIFAVLMAAALAAMVPATTAPHATAGGPAAQDIHATVISPQDIHAT
ncbi:hypothetical protein ACFYZ9_03255 [Streptomyces sp. NPDC001691]|uniref:hypothetical protein n=1 Tax=Streptomyces sp. NPDC001691 TaxID=3364600 RepID=UPI0036989E53